MEPGLTRESMTRMECEVECCREDVPGAVTCFWSAALGAGFVSILYNFALMTSQRDRKKMGKEPG